MKNSIKVLYHSRTFATGGARVHIDSIVRQLRMLDCEVKIVEPIRGGRKAKKAVFLSNIKARIPSCMAELLELLYSFKAYRDLCKFNGFSFIYERHALFNLAGAWYAKNKKIPFIIEVNSPLAYEREKYQKLFFKKTAYRLEKWVLKKADKVICVSEKLKKILVGYGIDPKKIIVNHNGIDKDYAISKKDKYLLQKYNLNEKVVIGFAGYMIPWHGGDILISVISRLLKEYKNIVFLLIGGIDYGIDLTAVNEFNKRFIIIENVEHEKIYNYINLFDIGVMAQSNEYGSPMKLIEYMGLEKATIGPDTDAVKELIDGKNTGLLVKSGDDRDLYEKLDTLILDKLERERIGKNSREFIITRKMTWQDNAMRIISEYKSISTH